MMGEIGFEVYEPKVCELSSGSGRKITSQRHLCVQLIRWNDE